MIGGSKRSLVPLVESYDLEQLPQAQYRSLQLDRSEQQLDSAGQLAPLLQRRRHKAKLEMCLVAGFSGPQRHVNRQPAASPAAPFYGSSWQALQERLRHGSNKTQSMPRKEFRQSDRPNHEDDVGHEEGNRRTQRATKNSRLRLSPSIASVRELPVPA